jgi:cell wall-associated NlpC family hydrolase
MDVYDFMKRYRYQLASLLAFVLIISYCGIKKEPEVYNLRGKITDLTIHLAGMPYRYGGDDLEGFDCSGLVFYVYDAYGIRLPRTAKKQARLETKIKFKHAKPADILAFKLKGRYHTAIYIGNNTFIHAPNKNTPIRKEHINSFWKKHLKAVIRILN